MFRIHVAISLLRDRVPVLVDLGSGAAIGTLAVYFLGALTMGIFFGTIWRIFPARLELIFLYLADKILAIGAISTAATGAVVVVAAFAIAYAIKGAIQRYKPEEVAYRLLDADTEKDEVLKAAIEITPENSASIEFWNSDPVKNVVSSYLDAHKFSSLSQTCKGLKILFQGKLDTYKLLKLAAEDAEWSKAAELAEKDPQLILEHVMWHGFRDEDGYKRPLLISPLKAVVHICDSYMLSQFEDIIQKHCPDKMPLFEQQIKTHSDRLTLQPLFDYYQSVSVLPPPLQRLPLEQWNRMVVELSDLQLTYLPMHMIKEMCRGGR